MNDKNDLRQLLAGARAQLAELETNHAREKSRATAVQAVAETAAVLCTGVVIYLSVNAVTHPWTLKIQLTHLLPGPSEGTVRVLALVVCLVATAASRYLRSSGGQVTRPPAGWEKADMAAEQSTVT